MGNSKGRLKGTTPRVRKLNSYLDQVYSQTLDTHKKLLGKDNLITAAQIYSIEGRLLGAVTAGSKNSIPLAKGMYLVVFQMENGSPNVERLIVQ